MRDGSPHPAVMLITLLLVFGMISFPINAKGFNESNDPKTSARSDSVNNFSLTLPADCHVMKATINISDVEGSHPKNVSVSIENSTIWAFNGSAYGTLGLQKHFSDDNYTASLNYNDNDAAKNVTVRLPKKANILDGSFDITGFAPQRVAQLMEYSCDTSAGGIGPAICSGDINGDGYSDIIVGSPYSSDNGYDSGSVYIYLGGHRLDAIPYLELDDGSIDAFFGWSVAAGDFNGDGYDDIIVGAPYAFATYLYFGGPTMDNIPDVIFNSIGGGFGSSVANLGDINGDGIDDFIIGTPWANQNNGIASIYFGGNNISQYPKITLEGKNAGDCFGSTVSYAGDVNGDGFNDILVGAPGVSIGLYHAGAAYVYFGGNNIDHIPDVIIPGEAMDDEIGSAIAGISDVNKDGYDDILLGCYYHDFNELTSGIAYLYLGGPNMGKKADLIMRGNAPDDYFGISVSGCGDINQDGYPDFMVGGMRATEGGPNTGTVYFFYGGKQLSGTPGFLLSGSEGTIDFGESIAFAGDTNKDGMDDILIDDTDELQGGGLMRVVHLYSSGFGILNPTLSIGKTDIWRCNGFLNDTETIQDFSQAMNEYLQTAFIKGIDGYGNGYVDVPITASTDGSGNLTFTNLKVTYHYGITTNNFANTLNEYLTTHRAEKDDSGNITVPIKVASGTPGQVDISDFNILIDHAPTQLMTIPSQQMDEDTIVPDLIDLRQYFTDDFDKMEQLQFGIVSATNSSIIGVEINDNQYLFVDAQEVSQEYSWSGVVSIVFNCTDHWGSETVSNQVDIVIRHVNHPPVITSEPNSTAIGGQEYQYQVTAFDRDNDSLTFNLTKGPENMTLNKTSGLLSWTPEHWGKYPVFLTVSDGQFVVSQKFSVIVADRRPRLTSQSVPDAFIGRPFVYNISAVDDDGDTLELILIDNPPGMVLDSATGQLIWTPLELGDVPISIKISDSQEYIFYNFTVTIRQGNRSPVIHTSPVAKGIVGIIYQYDVNATDADNDLLDYSLLEMPSGMTIDSINGLISWRPNASGNYSVKIRVFDGKDGEAIQQFVINVAERVGPNVELTTPAEGKTVTGRLIMTGKAFKGSLPLILVQVRIDNGNWMAASGLDNWSLVIDLNRSSNGSHRIEARAFDGSLYSESAFVEIRVDHPGTTISLDGLIGFLWMPVLVIAVAGLAGYFVMRKRMTVKGGPSEPWEEPGGTVTARTAAASGTPADEVEILQMEDGPQAGAGDPRLENEAMAISSVAKAAALPKAVTPVPMHHVRCLNCRTRIPLYTDESGRIHCSNCGRIYRPKL